MSMLCDGDLITLYLDHDSDETGDGDGFLGSDNGEAARQSPTHEIIIRVRIFHTIYVCTHIYLIRCARARHGCVHSHISGSDRTRARHAEGLFSSSIERLLVAPAKRTPTGEMSYPASFQKRCLFRLRSTGSVGSSLVYGQPIMLVHADTEMCVTAVSPEEVELHPSDEVEASGRRMPSSAFYFFPEPHYKLRSEGDLISAGDNIVLQSRRFAGSYLHLSTIRAPTPSLSPSQAKRQQQQPGGLQVEVPKDGLSRLGISTADVNVSMFEEEADAADGTDVSKSPCQVVLYNLRSTQGWVIQRFAAHQPDGGESGGHNHADSNADGGGLRGADSIMFFHREREGYVVAGLKSEALRAEDYPLDSILAMDGRGVDWSIRMKCANHPPPIERVERERDLSH